MALVLTGVVVAVIAAFAVEQLWVRESAVESGPPTAVVEPEAENGEQQTPPESNVARERAALDAQPPKQ